MMKTILIWLSVLSGIIAAVLWFAATVVTVPYERKVVNGMAEAAITETDDVTGKEINVLYTAKKQTMWNRWAALATGVSMLCQAISLLL